MKLAILTACLALLANESGAFAAASDSSTPNNAFAAELYAKLASTKGNLFFSPFSIHSALGMARAGAAGDTARQMTAVLKLNPDEATAAKQFAEEFAALKAGGESGETLLYKLVIANGLWIQRGYPIQPGYVANVKNNFDGEVADADFASEAEASRQAINGWIAQKTADKIKELLAPGSIDPTTRLILANAIYFKSAWQDPFHKSQTADAPFHILGSADAANVPMMHNRLDCEYYEDDSVQVIALPYAGYGLSMVIALPKKLDGLGAVETHLTAETIDQWKAAAHRAQVTLALPRFKLENRFDLGRTLAAMGMSDAFAADRANFSGISTAEHLFIGGVVHQATIDVDEQGTEAAAATALVMLGSARMKMEERTVTVDHPFFFAIRHNQTGAILFAGRVVDPRG